MKTIRIIAAFAVFVFLAACTQEQIAANEAKAKAVLSAINNGARVTAAALREGIDAVCANQSAIYGTATVARVTFSTQSGPNTTQNLANLDRALAAYNNACAAASDPAASNTATLLRTAVSAYNSVKAAQSATGG